MPLIAKYEPDERRSKIDPMTGEERKRQPTWTPDQHRELADLGTSAMQHGHYDRFSRFWRANRYSDPIDTLHLARELLTELGITVPPGTSED